MLLYYRITPKKEHENFHISILANLRLVLEPVVFYWYAVYIKCARDIMNLGTNHYAQLPRCNSTLECLFVIVLAAFQMHQFFNIVITLLTI